MIFVDTFDLIYAISCLSGEMMAQVGSSLVTNSKQRWCGHSGDNVMIGTRELFVTKEEYCKNIIGREAKIRPSNSAEII